MTLNPDVVDTINRALVNFEDGDAWCKGTLRVHRGGNKLPALCLISGLDHAMGFNASSSYYWSQVRDAVRTSIVELYPDRVPAAFQNLAFFNDLPSTKWLDIKRVLEHARDKASHV